MLISVERSLMKQSVKLGLMVLVVALLAASGIAIAQSNGEDADPDPPIETPTTEAPAAESESADVHDHAGLVQGFEFGSRAERHAGFGIAFNGLDGVAQILGLERDALFSALRDGSTLVEIAAEQGVDEATLLSELTALAHDSVDQAVTDGLIDQERAEDLLARIDDHLVELVNRSFDDFGRHRGHHHRVARGFIGDEVSEILGLSKLEIHDLLEGGLTLAEVAEQQGVDPETLIDGVSDEFRQRFSERVYGLEDGN